MDAEVSLDALMGRMDAAHARVSGEQRRLFELLVEAERAEVWRDWGARDMPHFVSMRFGISWWKADRWIAAARALERLPLLAEAFASGRLGIDKVVELARFAAPDTEHDLIRWAEGVSPGAVRRRAELAARRSIEEVRQVESARSLHWWHEDEGRRLALAAELPAAEGAVIVRAIERMAERVPVMPGEEEAFDASARRADALVALCSGALAADPDPDRASVVVHVPLAALAADQQGCEIEGGGVIHAETARRLGCTARLQAVVEDESGTPVGLGRMSREPSAWMLRALRRRDHECRFPGCGARRFTQAHHIEWWSRGGRTDLDNLVLLCFFHHKLVHEHGWSIGRTPWGAVDWTRPDGQRYRRRCRPGPADSAGLPPTCAAPVLGRSNASGSCRYPLRRAYEYDKKPWRGGLSVR